MLCWQQNQREDFHTHLLGQAVLDEKQIIIPSLTATSESSSKPHSRLPSEAVWKAKDTVATCLVGRTLFRTCPIAARARWAGCLWASRWDSSCCWPLKLFMGSLVLSETIPFCPSSCHPAAANASTDIQPRSPQVHVAEVRARQGPRNADMVGEQTRRGRDILSQLLHSTMLWSNLATASPHPQ